MDITGFLEFLKSKRVIISRKKLICLAVFISLWASISYWSGGWLIYHKPEFKGKVMDAETKEPIEGAVVVVEYDKHDLLSGPAGGNTSVVKVKDTLTDERGEFRFPPYTAVIQPNSYGDDAVFTFYKPGFRSSPEFEIWALPGGLGFPTYKFSTILKNRVAEKWKQDFADYLKTIPKKERAGIRGGESIKYLNLYFALLRMNNAREKLQRLEIPFFKIPDDIDLRTIKFIRWTRKLYPRNIEEKSDYVVYGLSKAKSAEDWLSRPSIPTDIGPKELPLLYKAMHEEEEEVKHRVIKRPTGPITNGFRKEKWILRYP